MRTYTEPARETPVAYEPDVIVCGGGVTGCAAALSAAHSGASVLLVERNGVLGGTATAGLMANIGNLFMTGEDTPVVKGVPREIVERMAAAGGTRPNWSRAELPGVVIDPEVFKMVLLDMLREAGVEVLFHALTVGAVMEGNAVRGVIIESKSGRQAAISPAVLDATGDADVAHFAGAPYSAEPNGGSLEFRLCNVDLDRAVDYFEVYQHAFPAGRDYVRDFDSFARNYRDFGFFFFPHGGGAHFQPWLDVIERGEYHDKEGDWYGLNAFGLYGLRGDGTVVVNSNFLVVDGVDVRSLSRAQAEAHIYVKKATDFLRRYLPGFENAHIVAMAHDWGQRLSRLIEGRAKLTKQDALEGRKWDEVIARAPTKRPDEPPLGYEIPFGVMAPQGIEGLLVPSGKNVSTEPRGMLRGMSYCMSLGTAAGAAAAVGAARKLGPAEAPIREIQAQLIKLGTYLGEPDRLAELGLVT